MSVLLTGCGGGGVDGNSSTPMPNPTEYSDPTASPSGELPNPGLSGKWDQARCEAAGYMLSQDCPAPNYDDEEINWKGVGKDGGSIEIYIVNDAGGATASGEILLKKN